MIEDYIILLSAVFSVTVLIIALQIDTEFYAALTIIVFLYYVIVTYLCALSRDKKSELIEEVE